MGDIIDTTIMKEEIYKLFNTSIQSGITHSDHNEKEW